MNVVGKGLSRGIIEYTIVLKDNKECEKIITPYTVVKVI